MKKFIFYLVFLLIYTAIYLFTGGFSSPKIDLEGDYLSYANIYVNDERGIAFLRVREKDSEQIRYFLETGEDYYLVIASEKYHNLKTEVFLDEVYEKRFVEIEVYSKDEEFQEALQFYYATDPAYLEHVHWKTWGFDYKFFLVPALVLLIFLASLLTDLLGRKKMKRERSEEFNPWKRFKEASVLSKIGYVFLLLIYLVLPHPFLFLFYIALFSILLLMGKGFWGRAKTFGLCLLACLVGVLVFLGLYIGFVPEAWREYVISEPENLSPEGREAYRDLVSDAEYYSKEPVAHHEDNFGFLALRTYREWTYSDGEPISVIYVYRFYNLEKKEKNKLQILFIQNDKIEHLIDYAEKESRVEEFLPKKEENIVIEIRESGTNRLLYRSEEFPALKNIEAGEVYFGGQYMENENKVIFLFIVFTHLGAVASFTLLYLFRKTIIANIKFRRKDIEMEIKRKDNCFYLGPSYDYRIGEIIFRNEGEEIAVLHTFVDKEHRGQGLAGKLVEAVVELARSEGKQINPICPYVRKVLAEEEYADVYRKD